VPPVLDASVAASWAFPDEGQPHAALALEAVRHEEAHVPSLWRFEVWNVLVVSERRGRIAEADTRAFLHALSRLAIAVDRSPDETSILALARRHQLTA
jgi:predicted nucleic acid-binding protein